jgi:chromatin segregation and condensation protein Rec8/ScpA/Scc1 (kleisin family)
LDDLQLPGSDFGGGGVTGLTGDEEFELFGPAAQVDTQTAAQSQWQRATLVGETANFLDFVRTAIEDLDDGRRKVAEETEEDMSLGTIEFEELLPRMSNSNVVAAQGFLHALALGTRHMLKLSQEEAFGSITMEIIDV